MKISAFFVEYDTVSQYPGIGGSLLLTPKIAQCILAFNKRDWMNQVLSIIDLLECEQRYNYSSQTMIQVLRIILKSTNLLFVLI